MELRGNPGSKTLIERGHLLRQIVQRTPAFHLFLLQWGRLHNRDQPPDRILRVLQRLQPPLPHNLPDHLVHQGIAQSLFVREMVVQRALGHARCFENRIQVCPWNPDRCTQWNAAARSAFSSSPDFRRGLFPEPGRASMLAYQLVCMYLPGCQAESCPHLPQLFPTVRYTGMNGR